jgi:hypothetical protein
LRSDHCGAALAWNGEVCHIPNLVHRHNTTICFVVSFQELNLLIGVDAKGGVFALHTNQINEQTKQLVCQTNVYKLPQGENSNFIFILLTKVIKKKMLLFRMCKEYFLQTFLLFWLSRLFN